MQMTVRNEAVAAHYRVVDQVERDVNTPTATMAEWRRTVEAVSHYYAELTHKWAGVAMVDGRRLDTAKGDPAAAQTFAVAAAHLALTRYPEHRCIDIPSGIAVMLYTGSHAFAVALGGLSEVC